MDTDKDNGNHYNHAASVKDEEVRLQEKPSWCCSIRMILVNLALLNVFYISFFVFSAGSVRTIEKRFDLRSTQTGFMNSVEDIIQVLIVVFPSYLGTKLHKLRLLAGFMTITGVGILLTNIPYIAYGPKVLVPEVTSQQVQDFANSSISQKMAMGVCVPGEQFVDARCATNDEKNSNLVAFGIFILANMLVGLGTAPTHALATSYIDENSSEKQGPVYIGILEGAKSVSPIIGSLLAAAVLKLPENLKDSVVGPENPNWIGAWWLGFAVIGSGIILLCLPLFFTPRHQPEYYRQKARRGQTKKGGMRNGEVGQKDGIFTVEPKTKQATNKNTKTLMVHIKAFLLDLRRLLTNWPFLTITASYVCFLYVIMGIFINLGRYMEIHFRLSPSFANVISGVAIMTGALGTVVGGFLMRRFKLSTQGAAIAFVITCIIATVGTFINMFVSCNPVNLAGTMNDQTHLFDVNMDCAGNCSCGMKFYQPVCVNGDLNYFSPCHAGCHTQTNETYADCSCVPEDLSVSAGQCEGPCSSVYIYLVVMAVAAFTSSLGKVPGIMVGLRVMDKELKSLGLGVQTLMLNLFTFMPGPLIFGALFDSSCIVWKSSCGNSGNCLLYDTDRFRFLMHGPTTGFQAAAAIFAFITYLLIRRDPKYAKKMEDLYDNENDKVYHFDQHDQQNGYICQIARSTRL